MDRQTGGQMDGWADEWMNVQMNGWKDRQMTEM